MEELEADADMRSRAGVRGITAEDRADPVAAGIDMSEDRPVIERLGVALSETRPGAGDGHVTIDRQPAAALPAHEHDTDRETLRPANEPAAYDDPIPADLVADREPCWCPVVVDDRPGPR